MRPIGRVELEAALRRAEQSDEGRVLAWLADVLAVLLMRRRRRREGD